MTQLGSGYRRAIHRGIAVASFGAVITSLYACKGKGDKAADKPGAAAPADSAAPAEEEAEHEVAASTIIVKAGGFIETVGAAGTVAARSDHLASVAAPISARIAAVTAFVGQRVNAGDRLVELDQTPFRAATESANAALVVAQANYDRAKRLSADGIIPRKELEQATGDLARANADVNVANRNAQLATIKAPINGVITRVTAAIGASVDPSQPLIEIADPTAVDILVNVTPSDAGRIRTGATAQLSAGQNVGGESLGVGIVADVAALVDSSTRTVSVRVQAPTTRRPLRIGETIFADVTVGVRPGAITVPIESLVPGGDHYTVFVVDAGGIAHVREVEVGGRSSTAAEITGGLKSGERVVTHGAFGVQDNVKIVPPDKS